MNLSLTDEMLREKLAALINEGDRKWLEKRCSSPHETAHALAWELANMGMITYDEYKTTVLRLCLAVQDHLHELRDVSLAGATIKPSDVLPRAMLELSRSRAEAIRQLQWALRDFPKWRGEETPRYREVMRFLESLGDEDKPCHICGAKPGEQGGVFCSACACVACTWKEGRIVEFCPEHASHEHSRVCSNCEVCYNASWQDKCPACGFPND